MVCNVKLFPPLTAYEVDYDVIYSQDLGCSVVMWAHLGPNPRF